MTTNKQAGAELCQAQGKLRLVGLSLDPYFPYIKQSGFANLAHEFDYGFVTF